LENNHFKARHEIPLDNSSPMSVTQSLCGSEVTRKIKQLEVEGGTCPSAP